MLAYVEADPVKRSNYLLELKALKDEQLVYLDESGIDRNISKSRSWVKRGSSIKGFKSGKFYERINIIAALNKNRSLAPVIFNGSCTTKFFNAWVAQFLLKELRPGQVVVMDNAAFHKSPKTRELIESVGCRIIFLPPYSPDLNPIEKFWANMKRWIKNKFKLIHNSWDVIIQFFNQ